jgi:hypothetical protein
MKWILSRLTMARTNEEGFIDIVAGDYVKYWIDCFGCKYLAVYKFGNRVIIN